MPEPRFFFKASNFLQSFKRERESSSLTEPAGCGFAVVFQRNGEGERTKRILIHKTNWQINQLFTMPYGIAPKWKKEEAKNRC